MPAPMGPISGGGGGAQSQGSIDDVIRKLQELVDLSTATKKAQEATEQILKNPELRVGGPYTQLGRWWERQRQWKPFAEQMTSRRVWRKRIMPGAKRAGAVIGRLIGGKQGAKIGAGLGSEAGAVIGGTGGPIIGSATLLATAAYDAYQAMNRWTEAALKSAERLTEFSGSMSAVFAEKEVRDMIRDIRVGEATAASTARLMRSEADRKDVEAEIEIHVTNVTNRIVAALNTIATAFLEPMIKIVSDIDEAFKKAFGAGGPPGPVGIPALIPDMMKVVDDAEKRAGDLLARARDMRAGAIADRRAGPVVPPGP